MNVLLLYPELPFSFWSFNRLCRLRGVRSIAAPLGPITVAALFPASWSVRLIDLNTRPLTQEDWDWCDLVMVSSMLVQREGTLQLIREAKARGKITAAGGPYPTALPDDFLEAGCDLVFCGEAEGLTADLIRCVEQGSEARIIEQGGRPDLAESPVPRFDLLRLRDYLAPSVQTSRGCPHDCEFCDVVSLFGRRPRYKRAGQVVEELEVLYRLGARGPLLICDDNFIGHRAHALAILAELIPWMERRGKPFNFITQVSLNLGRDRELIDGMTQANFSDVFIGLESPDKEVLEGMEKKQNLAGSIHEDIRSIMGNGLSVIGSFIMGCDGERKGVGERIVRLVEETHIPTAAVGILQPLPGTRLWKRLEREGRLLEEFPTCQTLSPVFTFVPERPESEILQEYRETWKALYEPGRFLSRGCRSIMHMRPTRKAMAAAKGEPVPRARRAGLPVRTRLRDVGAFCHILWMHGIRGKNRRRFLNQLRRVWRKRPSRFIRYLNGVVFFDDLEAMSRRVHRGDLGRGA